MVVSITNSPALTDVEAVRRSGELVDTPKGRKGSSPGHIFIHNDGSEEYS